MTGNTSSVSLTVLLIAASHAEAQTVLSTTVKGPVSIPANMGLVTFVASNANTAQDAVKDAAIGAGQQKVIAAVATKALPIPVVGSLPVEGLMKVFSHKKNQVKGFYIAFLQGLTAQSTVSPVGVNFTIPADAVAGQATNLVHLHPSPKDSARIIRSTHVSVKLTGSNINPAAQEVLGSEQEIVICASEKQSNGDVLLTPKDPLPPGEYAVILTPAGQATGSTDPIHAWDFRVAQ